MRAQNEVLATDQVYFIGANNCASNFCGMRYTATSLPLPGVPLFDGLDCAVRKIEGAKVVDSEAFIPYCLQRLCGYQHALECAIRQ